MSEKRKKQIHEAVEKAFKYYEEKGYDGHIKQPEIIEESKEFAEKLAEKEMHKSSKGFNYVASIATYLVCESHGCPINLNMAKNFSTVKIKTKDLHEARKITGVEPKLNPIDWVDDVVRTLKNKDLISPKDEEKIIESAVLELNKIKTQTSPRYKAITAVYRAMKNSGIKITSADIRTVFNISEPVLRERHDYNQVNKQIVEFLKNNPETFYQTKDLVKILKLDVDPKSLSISLSSKAKKLGLLNLVDNHSYFGFSNECGSGKCDINWCYGKTDYWDKPLCKRGSRNEKIKFYSKD